MYFCDARRLFAHILTIFLSSLALHSCSIYLVFGLYDDYFMQTCQYTYSLYFPCMVRWLYEVCSTQHTHILVLIYEEHFIYLYSTIKIIKNNTICALINSLSFLFERNASVFICAALKLCAGSETESKRVKVDNERKRERVRENEESESMHFIWFFLLS